jgi:hypothetical protein
MSGRGVHDAGICDARKVFVRGLSAAGQVTNRESLNPHPSKTEGMRHPENQMRTPGGVEGWPTRPRGQHAACELFLCEPLNSVESAVSQRIARAPCCPAPDMWYPRPYSKIDY